MEKEYFFRLRYRDQNLKWSNWTVLARFTTLGMGENHGIQTGYILNQNYPNPFQNNTVITYSVPGMCEIKFHIYDQNYKLVGVINEGTKNKGTYQLDYKAKNLGNNIYYYEMISGKISIAKKMIKIK